ncbi:MAG: acyltransferase family protein [Chitinophagales bacterium]|nr:acyltransferase family protein [Chitinophagales bacterium]
MLEAIKKILQRDEEVKNFLKNFPNDVGEYGYDAWGFNIKTIKRYITLGRYFYEDFFEVEVIGNENVPKEGRCLVIANHSGQLPIDAILLGYALVVNPVAPRAPKGMFERFIPTLPFFSYWFSQMGGAVGDIENCIKMLNNDEAVIVFPEGARGISKPSSKKYQLQSFGRGFLHMARKTNSPIIPVGIAGCEEILYSFGNIDFLEKFLRFPAAPILVPYLFKSKVIINIGKPIYFENKEESDYLAGADVKIVKKEIERLIAEGREIREKRMKEK